MDYSFAADPLTYRAPARVGLRVPQGRLLYRYDAAAAAVDPRQPALQDLYLFRTVCTGNLRIDQAMDRRLRPQRVAIGAERHHGVSLQRSIDVAGRAGK
jgi:hypothetical protein